MPCPGDPGPRPYFIPAPLTAKVVLDHTLFNQQVQNVLHFTKSTDWNSIDLAALTAGVAASWLANLAPQLPPPCVLSRIRATDESGNTNAYSEIYPATAGTNGQNAFNAPQATLALKFSTAKKGRSYRGRFYWPCLILEQVTGGVVAQATATAYIVAMQDFIAQIEGLSSSPVHVVTSYQNDCAWRTTAVSEPVTGYSFVDRNVDTQRRRAVGAGI